MRAREREAWASTPLPAVIVPNAVTAGVAGSVRERLETAGYARYTLLDRASYDEAVAVDEPAVVDALAAIASEVTGRSLVADRPRVLRFGPGDYSLVRHDRVHDERPVELVLDLSATSVPGAEVHYRHRGQVFFTFPCSPGALALVERGPTVLCNHTYLSRRHANASVVRLLLLLRNRHAG